MPTAPDIGTVQAYLASIGSSASDGEAQNALAAETAAQARVCRIPVDVDLDDPQPYPADLAEALCRRVAVNLANRVLPLGIQVTLSDVNASQTRVGGGDAEVRRLEAPYRRLVVG